MNPICQKDEYSPFVRVDPDACSRESVMAECRRRKRRPRRAALSFRQDPSERSRRGTASSQVAGKQTERFRLQKLAAREKLICNPKGITRGREQSGVSGNTVHKARVSVVNLTPDHV